MLAHSVFGNHIPAQAGINFFSRASGPFISPSMDFDWSRNDYWFRLSPE
jgi:hypothetical protein